MCILYTNHTIRDHPIRTATAIANLRWEGVVVPVVFDLKSELVILFRYFISLFHFKIIILCQKYLQKTMLTEIGSLIQHIYIFTENNSFEFIHTKTNRTVWNLYTSQN